MRRRLVIITEIISPYRIPLFNALAAHAEVNLHVIFLAETDPDLRQWKVYREEIKFSYQVLPSWRKHVGQYNMLINRGVNRALTAAAPDAIVCGGYNYVASWQSLLWARMYDVPFLLWSESNQQDMRGGHALVELLKDEFLCGCSGFVVPGRSAREYLQHRKIKKSRIFTAPNAVDNCFFAKVAAEARQNAAQRRAEFSLPVRYILFAGRLVREKGVLDLLSAYAKLDDRLRQQVGLVFAGDGPERAKLKERAASISPGVIVFPGFAQRERLGAYYALAEMLVLPTYSDTWGLVVNEALACGLPVVLSRNAGCAADLVKENWNGLLIALADVQGLVEAMQRLLNDPDMCAKMGSNSLELISRYSALEWSSGIVEAIAATAPGSRQHFD